MGGGSAGEEELRSSELFEHEESDVVPSKQSLQTAEPKQWGSPAQVEPREYMPPPPEDYAPSAFDSGFTPVEYVPPTEPSMASEPMKLESQLFDEEQTLSIQKTSIPGREKTIYRLEKWLKNIVKEK